MEGRAIRFPRKIKSPVSFIARESLILENIFNSSMFISGLIDYFRISNYLFSKIKYVNFWSVLLFFVACLIYLTLSWRTPLSYRNQFINLLCKSIGWFLYDNGLRHERVKVKAFVHGFLQTKPTYSFKYWLFSRGCAKGCLLE